MSRVSEAMGRLAARASEYAGETFTCERPGVEPVHLVGWRAAEGPEVTGGDVPVDSEDQDLCFATSELSKLSGVAYPTGGDVFVSRGGERFAVKSNPFDRYWRYLDSHRQAVRVHTQRINVIDD